MKPFHSAGAVVILTSAILATSGATSSAQSMSTTTHFGMTTAQGTFVCSATLNNPHYSRGAASVIFKTRIACEGDTPPIQMRIFGRLGSVSGGSPGNPAAGPTVPRASSDQTQTIPMGGSATYYTPVVGGTKVRGSATYQGDIDGQVVGPPGAIGSGPNPVSSNRVYVVDPG